MERKKLQSITQKDKKKTYHRRAWVRFILFVNRFVCIAALLSYCAAFVPPTIISWVSLLALSIPVWQVFLLFFVVLWVQRKRFQLTTYSLICLALGYKFLFYTFAISFGGEQGQFSVLSYNVHIFDVYENYQKTDKSSSKRMIDWVMADDSDFKCLQEFYNDKNSEVYNTLEQLSSDKSYEPYFEVVSTDNIGAEFGMAIFSKHPVLRKGEIMFNERTPNRAIFIDAIVNRDTVRVYNVHLQSMHIDQEVIKTENIFKKVFWAILERFEEGAMRRTEQIRAIERHILQCPYQNIVLCGDLNDLPYSFSYITLKNHLENSFESKGLGLGFTFNSWVLFFLRIDNIFYSPSLICNDFLLDRQVNYSDHFPIKSRFSLASSKKE
ncbi:MAG: hypothetical protein EAZ57_01365 [Cytophagales bacterium]|nr:MAG: hypothetical protein EAZ67_01910 [Cytophagales bacterium]TAF62099.1 MAG: hypothetical protein EAZ57_01365 [Cytophagales bacterium]